jgi:hypothetical protein
MLLGCSSRNEQELLLPPPAAAKLPVHQNLQLTAYHTLHALNNARLLWPLGEIRECWRSYLFGLICTCGITKALRDVAGYASPLRRTLAGWLIRPRREVGTVMHTYLPISKRKPLPERVISLNSKFTYFSGSAQYHFPSINTTSSSTRNCNRVSPLPTPESETYLRPPNQRLPQPP